MTTCNYSEDLCSWMTKTQDNGRFSFVHFRYGTVVAKANNDIQGNRPKKLTN